MSTLRDLWPPYGVTLVEGDLTLTVQSDDDVSDLVDLALAGIHAPEAMPFSTPWTDDDPALMPANMIRFYSSLRAGFTPEAFDLVFTVRLAGKVVGQQNYNTRDFVVTRTGETGSWIGRDFHGRGIGTRMRQIVCAFAFDELDAVEVTSGAFLDNPASLAVSRKVGYRPNGVVRMTRRGESAPNQKLVLTPETFVRGAPLTVTGAAGLRRFLGLDEGRSLGRDDRGV